MENAVINILSLGFISVIQKYWINESMIPERPIKARLIVEKISLTFNLRDALYLAHDVSQADLLRLSKKSFIISSMSSMK